MNEIKKYPKPLIILHWLTVILLVIVFIKGKALEDITFNEANMNHFRFHALLGMLILVLTIIRMFLKNKYKNKLPAEITYYNNTHKIIVKTVRKLIYAFLIITPLTGFIMIFQTGAMTVDFGGAFPTDAHFNETLETLHKGAILILVISIVTHVVGVISYTFKTGENLIKRICTLIK